MSLSASWIDQWRRDDDGDLTVELGAFVFLWRPGERLAIKAMVCGFGFWAMVEFD